ncbi:tetratricopeptide repeat protein [bacterium]|nr:tetratricopeptide repeat protein [bacterium]MBU1064058.1 tetratricopeptide repeat protein [bacterium]MBU1874689.1 tetratricopeptide repeat protein [bacterium]
MKNKKLLLSIVSIAGVCLLCMSFETRTIAKPKTKDAGPNEELTSLQTQIGDIEQKLNKTVKLVNSLSGKVKDLGRIEIAPNNFGGQIGQLDSALHVLESVAAALSHDFVKLQRQVSLNARRASYTDSINFEILSQLVILENRIVSLGASLSETKSITNTQPASQTPVSGGTYRDRYLQALTFHQNGNNEESIGLFRQLLNEDKYHELADNAQYWIGECFYSMKQYQRGIVEFEKVFAFKDSNKEDDAQFKLGLCYAAMGERDKAIDEFQRLIDYYPQSEFVINAKQFVK